MPPFFRSPSPPNWSPSRIESERQGPIFAKCSRTGKKGRPERLPVLMRISGGRRAQADGAGSCIRACAECCRAGPRRPQANLSRLRNVRDGSRREDLKVSNQGASASDSGNPVPERYRHEWSERKLPLTMAASAVRVGSGRATRLQRVASEALTRISHEV